LSYPKSGNYVITLTVKNKDGKTATIIKNVKVLDRVAKQVVITNFFTTSPIAQSFNHSNVWAQIRYAGNDSTYLIPSNSSISSFEAPVIFKSPVLLNFDSSNSIPYTFTIPDKIILDYPSILLSNVKHTGNEWQHIGYGLELYAQNASGIYLLTSSYYPLYEAQSGGLRVDKADIQNNVFIISYGDIEVIGDYE
jgi:PKD repeat protein